MAERVPRGTAYSAIQDLGVVDNSAPPPFNSLNSLCRVPKYSPEIVRDSRHFDMGGLHHS